MSDTSPLLALPYIQAGQAQKHVTHNEALQRLDILVQLRVRGFDALTPPAVPVDGEIHALGATPTAAWAGQGLSLAAWINSAWMFVPLQTGWIAFGLDSGTLRIWNGTAWQMPDIGDLNNLAGLGVGTTADGTNRLAVQSPATLFNHDGAGHQMKINKAGMADTASLLFQNSFSGRAELGLAGNDDFSIKVSADGGTFTHALKIDRASGLASGAAVQSGVQDATPGRLMAVGAFGLGQTDNTNMNDTDDVDDLFGAPGGFYSWRGATPAHAPGPFTSVLQIPGYNRASAQLAIGKSGTAPSLFFRGNGSSNSVDSDGWRKVFHNRNILGTVTQTAGTPTGAMIERGNNANGEYVRFADGTQICATPIQGLASGPFTRTWPANFAASPRVAATITAGLSMATVTVANNTTTSIDVYTFNAAGAQTTAFAHLIAFGRWF